MRHGMKVRRECWPDDFYIQMVPDPAHPEDPEKNAFVCRWADRTPIGWVINTADVMGQDWKWV